MIFFIGIAVDLFFYNKIFYGVGAVVITVLLFVVNQIVLEFDYVEKDLHRIVDKLLKKSSKD